MVIGCSTVYSMENQLTHCIDTSGGAKLVVCEQRYYMPRNKYVTIDLVEPDILFCDEIHQR